jgi:hypothetical protein
LEGVRHEDSARRVIISSEQYFEGFTPEVWAFTIGGYQVWHKWLKDRKGRTLNFEDLHHYQRVIVALAETIHLIGVFTVSPISIPFRHSKQPQVLSFPFSTFSASSKAAFRELNCIASLRSSPSLS